MIQQVTLTHTKTAASIAAHQVDHLFLLMGENPLPNAVAAIALLRAAGTAHLIHTTFTETQAKRLAAVLQEIPHLKPAQLINLGDHQAEAQVIRQCIQQAAAPLTGRIGLNYTGGTKAMSVHAYRALAQIQPHTSFSYLDSHTLEMLIDHDHAASSRFPVAPCLTLTQLFSLHGLTWRSDRPPTTQPILPTAAAQFAYLYQSPELIKAWRSWCNGKLRQSAKNEYFRWREEAELKRLPPLSLQGLPDRLKQPLQQHLGATETLSLSAACTKGFKTLTQVCEWLDGIWLEHYVLQQVQQVMAQCNIHESRLGFRMQDLSKPDRTWDKFEFDVAFMRHYQLFALSCTTTDKRSLCKQKLIEANLRARRHCSAKG